MSELSELIPRYYEMKSEMDSYKKQVDEDNKAIKLLMHEGNKQSESVDDYVAKITVVDKSYFNEEKLIAKLKLMGNTEAIKTKEYVDMVVLENLLYNGEIDKSDVSDCLIEKFEERLSVKKTKKE